MAQATGRISITGVPISLVEAVEAAAKREGMTTRAWMIRVLTAATQPEQKEAAK